MRELHPRRRGLILFPLIRQPLHELAHRRVGQVGEQLREIVLWVDLVAAAGAGEGGQDGSGLAGAGLPTKRLFLRFSTMRLIWRSLALLSMATPHFSRM